MAIHKNVISPPVRPSLLLDFANSKSLDKRVTFTRNSTATYWDGKTTHRSSQNMIRRSQDFSTANWLYSSTAVASTSTVVAPDGANTAMKLTEVGTNTTTHAIAQTGSNAIAYIAGEAYTFSVYAKSAENSWLLIDLTKYNVANQRCWFSLTNGTSGTIDSNCTASSQNVGNGWYRLMVTSTPTGAGSWAPQIITANANNARSYAGTAGNGCYIWGAQLEQRGVATPLLATSQEPILRLAPTLLTMPAKLPRFDHKPSTGESLGLLVEEARTNQIPRSAISSTGWTFTNASLDGMDIAPNGATEARVIRPTGAGASFFLYNTNINANTVYTFSIYCKAAGLNHVQIASSSGFVAGFRNFNLADLTIGSNDIGEQGAQEGIEDVGNGWRRIWITETATTTTVGRFAVLPIPSATTTRINYGTGANQYNGVSFWGAQLEAGKGRTSLIPTSGSALARTADLPEISGAGNFDWYNREEGTLYAEFAVNLFNTSQGVVSMYQTGYGNDWMGFYSNAPAADGTSAITIAAYQASPASAIASGATIRTETAGSTNTYYEIGQFIKAITSYGPTETRSGGNGGANGEGTAQITVGTRHGPDHDVLSFHKLYQNGFNGKSSHIKKVAFYPKQITINQIEELVEE